MGDHLRARWRLNSCASRLAGARSRRPASLAFSGRFSSRRNAMVSAPLKMEPATQNGDQPTGTGAFELYATAVDPPVGHYAHLSLGKDAPALRPIAPPAAGRIVGIPQINGLHHRHDRAWRSHGSNRLRRFCASAPAHGTASRVQSGPHRRRCSVGLLPAMARPPAPVCHQRN